MYILSIYQFKSHHALHLRIFWCKYIAYYQQGLCSNIWAQLLSSPTPQKMVKEGEGLFCFLLSFYFRYRMICFVYCRVPKYTVINLFKTNLKDGSGAPCAGQRRESSWPEPLVKVELSDSWENFGFVPPMGSKRIIYGKNDFLPGLITWMLELESLVLDKEEITDDQIV